MIQLVIVIMKCCIIITVATTLTGMVRKLSAHGGQAPCSALTYSGSPHAGAGAEPVLFAANGWAHFTCSGVWRGARGQQPRLPVQRVRACSRGEQRAWSRHRTPQCPFHSSTHRPPMQVSQQVSYREIHTTGLPYKNSKMHSAGPLCIIHAENMETSYPDKLCFL